MSDYPFPEATRILNCSCGDLNYISAIPRLSDDTLRYCLENEKRKSGLQRLRAEAKHRKLDEQKPNVNLMDVIKDILHAHGQWKSFYQKTGALRMRLSLPGEPELLIQRQGISIQIGFLHQSGGKQYADPAFEYTLINGKWREDRFAKAGTVRDVRVTEKDGPEWSSLGATLFKESSIEFADELSARHWDNAGVEELVVEGFDTTTEKDQATVQVDTMPVPLVDHESGQLSLVF